MKVKKNIVQFSLISFLIINVLGCSDNHEITEIDTTPPDNIGATVSIKPDNSGEVTITPKGDNANKFFLDYGDGSDLSDTIAVGNPFTHIYAEGEYELVVTGLNIANEESEAIIPLNVNFKAPENLEVTINKNPNDPFTINISANADLSIGFEATFGEDNEAEPVKFNAGEQVEYTYNDIGDYEVQITALSGGKETTTYSEMISITNPLILPIDFESTTIEYAFFNFGGGEGEGVPIIKNPAPDDVNDSEMVAQYTKVSNSETWAGTSTTLNEPIDFTAGTLINMAIYSPEKDIPILLKIENKDDPDNFMEVIKTTTTSGEWEILSFDFSEIDRNEAYSVISIFFNFDKAGNGETYYFDHIHQTNPNPVALPLDFEGTANNYVFQEFDGSPVSIVSNPYKSGINTSDQVAEAYKVEGAGPYAGAFIDLETAIDFSETSELTIKVWSPRSNVPMLLKIEDPNDGSINMEVEGTITEKEKWSEVSFNFSGVSKDDNWKRLILFFDFGNPGKDEYYYFDDISFKQ